MRAVRLAKVLSSNQGQVQDRVFHEVHLPDKPQNFVHSLEDDQLLYAQIRQTPLQPSDSLGWKFEGHQMGRSLEKSKQQGLLRLDGFEDSDILTISLIY